MTTTSRWKRYVCLAFLLLSASTVYAHAVLVKALPAQDAVLASSPPAISLWFNEALEAEFSSVTLSDAAQRVVTVGALQSMPDNGLSVAIDSTLPAGTYAVRYRVLSVDGHIVEGRFNFRIEARGAP